MLTSSKAHNIKEQRRGIRKILSTGEALLTGKINCLFSRADKVDLQPDGTGIALPLKNKKYLKRCQRYYSKSSVCCNHAYLLQKSREKAAL